MKAILRLAAMGGMCLLTGCMSFAIEGDCQKTPDSHFGKETVHGSFYGFNWDDHSREVKKAGDGLGLFKVEYRTNFLYSLISVVSLGTYAPVNVDYWIEGPDKIGRPDKKRGK
ncbi:MAG: hypothetical protein HN380_10890 [Victivallales bacterium]|nr:hypothetical protein [Victivallales bacterium]